MKASAIVYHGTYGKNATLMYNLYLRNKGSLMPIIDIKK